MTDIVEEFFEDGSAAINGGNQDQAEGTNRTGTYVVKVRLHSEVPNFSQSLVEE